MPKTGQRSVIVTYAPVLHRGYLQFFSSRPQANELYVIGQDLLKEVDYLRKDLRALDPVQMVSIIKAMGIFKTVSTLTAKKIPALDKPGFKIFMPDEDVSREVGKLFKNAQVEYLPVFLRWDRRSLERVNKTPTGVKISSSKSDKQIMRRAFAAAGKSPDIWRRVGAVLITKDGAEVGVKTNQGEPSNHTPWIEGDPRNILNQGVGIEISTFMHAEAALVAEAAKQGTSLDGASIYVTTFPCPACAKLIAHSGIEHLFYSQGYGVLDGQRVLESQGVHLSRIVENSSDDHPDAWVPYKKGKP